MRTTGKLVRISALALGVGLAVAGCTSAPEPPTTGPTGDDDWAQVAELAAQEGHVVLYGNKDPAAYDALGVAFEEAYPGVTFEYVKAGNSSEIAIKVDQEEAAGADGADVVINNDTVWFDTKLGGSIAAPVGPTLASAEWQDVLYGDAVVPISTEPFLIAWNTDLVKDAPTSHADILANPQFAESNAIGLVDTVSSTINVMYTDLERGLEESGYEGDFWADLADMSPRLYPSSTPMAQSVGSGEIQVSIGQSIAAIVAVKNAGAPVDYVVPSDYAIGITFYAAALENSKRPNAAQALLDFMATEEGQEILNEEFGESAVAANKSITPIQFGSLTDAEAQEFTNRFASLFH